MIITFKDVEKMCDTPLAQVDPYRMKVALSYCKTYIEIAQNNDCTPFDEVVQRLNGFEPLEELLSEEPRDGE